jgi:uncharacterized protein
VKPPPAHTSSSSADLSAAEARALVISAQFGNGPAGDSATVLRRLGLLQLDALRRVDRAHRLTCLARMPAEASVEGVDDQLWSTGPAQAFETWVHAACLVPVEDWPLLRLARARTANREDRPADAVCAEVLAIVGDSDHGVTIRELEAGSSRTDGWQWSERKRAAEHLLWRGELICSERRNDRRIYDLPERRLTPAVLRTELSRELILETIARRVLAATGIATTEDVATYYSLTAADATEALACCGATQLTVENWPRTAWTLHTDLPPYQRRLLPESRLIGPFDNLIWDRDRTRRVHDFDYRFEAYKPAAKRVYGHYVMAVLDTDGRMLGRVDLRRQANSLEVIRSFAEPEVDEASLAAGLATAIAVLTDQMALK